ncbi:MAG: RDD family protein [Phycisphaerales bacterium]|nr:RDD family protein [Phycisphaerales bacterium]
MPPRESHGWIVTRALAGGGATLLHLPPREDGVGSMGVDAGVARSFRPLDSAPIGAVGAGRRVFLLYPAAKGRLVVYSIRVRPAGLSGHWIGDPAEGAQAEPSLSMGTASFASAAAYRDTLLVLTRGERWRLDRLLSGGWEEIPMPPVAAEPGMGWAALVEGAATPQVLELSGGRVVRWEWSEGDSWSPLLLTGAEGIAPDRVLAVFASGGDVCVASRTEAGYEVGSLGPEVEGRIASGPLTGSAVAAVPLSGGMRLAVLDVIHDEGAAGQAAPIERWELVETSLVSGRELYRGPPRIGILELSDEIRWLSLGMIGLTVGVLFYLLRPTLAAAEPVLPAGFALASPGRRMGAGAIDAFVVMVGVSAAFGLPIGRVVMVVPLLETPRGVVALATIVAAGSVLSTAGEWLTGRTLGKLVTGCRVVSVVPSRPRVGLAASLARNVFRWAFAPWAVLGMGPPTLRHRGDVVAGAAVAVLREGEREEPGSPS